MPAQEYLDFGEPESVSTTEVPGLKYVPDFISEADKMTFVREIDSSSEWSNALRRRVQHYGYRYDYRARSIDRTMKAAPFPPWLLELASRLFQSGLMEKLADQAIVNEYLPGQGIFRHVDCAPCFGPEVVSVSLTGGCIMQFFNADQGRKEELYLQSRSALGLSGDARYKWDHGIPARRIDLWKGLKISRSRRISVTFRTVILRDG